MNCEEAQEKLDRYLRHELDPDIRGELEIHLQECSRCKEALRNAEKLARVMSEDPTPPVPEGLSERILDHAEQKMAARRKSGKIIGPLGSVFDDSRVWRAAMAAAVLIGLGLGVLMGFDSAQEPAGARAVAARTVSADPISSYGLDYVAGNPADSLSGTFSRMVNNRQETED